MLSGMLQITCTLIINMVLFQGITYFSLLCSKRAQQWKQGMFLFMKYQNNVVKYSHL